MSAQSTETITLAAIGDLHVSETSSGQFSAMFEQVGIPAPAGFCG